MSTNLSTLISHQKLTELSQPIQELLSTTPYNPPESHDVSIKSLFQSLLPSKTPNSTNILPQIRDFCLLCALISSSYASTSPLLSWIPERLIVASHLAIKALSEAVYGDSHPYLRSDTRLVIDLMPEVIPLIKETIKESSIGGDEISAASSRVPTSYAIVAAYQLSWFVSQVKNPELGKLCGLIIPCGLTALDHWSSEVKGQGMSSFIHVAKNVNTADLGGYGDVILDACCHNIVSDDEIWHLAVEMSVCFVTCLQRNNPRSPWFERLLNDMLGHLERQPRDKKRRIAWLKLVQPLFCCVGLVLLAHFRRLFPLFFQWVHADDDETVLLALESIYTVVKLTWLRSSPHTIRLVDELAILYKEAALKTARDDIRVHIYHIMILLQQSKGLQFEVTWEKYKDDPNLGTLVQSITNGFPVLQ
ncbi:uncharacterized protein At2g39910-like [Chenopodium quinoa]|uniref:uncharacterized protein At2g39910-like n=1 Tax=Chenopodium quinoa TaxID=63459 RepID=UPI000B786945|nr:uncharacterized protein At2g39910-like [Chenopodium quinoa]